MQQSYFDKLLKQLAAEHVREIQELQKELDDCKQIAITQVHIPKLNELSGNGSDASMKSASLEGENIDTFIDTLIAGDGCVDEQALNAAEAKVMGQGQHVPVNQYKDTDVSSPLLLPMEALLSPTPIVGFQEVEKGNVHTPPGHLEHNAAPSLSLPGAVKFLEPDTPMQQNSMPAVTPASNRSSENSLKEPVSFPSSVLTCDDEVPTMPSGAGFEYSSHKLAQALFAQSVPEYWRKELEQANRVLKSDHLSFVRARKQIPWQLKYDFVIGFLIIANAVLIGYAVQYQSTHHESTDFDTVGGCIFAILFTIDICYRIWREPMNFFFGRDRNWNYFDFVIVILMMVEELLRILLQTEATFLKRLAALRIVRLLRFVRLLQVIRVLAMFEEVQMLANTMILASRVMIWVGVIVLALAFMTGVLLTEGAYDTCKHGHTASLCGYFGRLDQALITTYQAMFGGVLWGEVMDALEVLHPVYPFIFVGMISFILVIMMNTITAVVLEMVARIAKRPEARRKEKRECIETLTRIFNDLDPNKSGDIGVNDITNAFRNNPKIEGSLNAIDLDVNDDERTFFEMLDRDKTGVVQKSEFVLGCLRLKGEAKAVDIVRVQQNMLELRMMLGSIMDKLAINKKQTKAISDPNMGEDTVFSQPNHVGKAISKKTLPGLSRDISSRLADGAIQPMMVVGCRIPKTEERAMSLKELRNLKREIQRRCDKEGWADMKTGVCLNADEVNLYHLTYSHICPLTTPEGVLLEGMKKHHDYKEGQIVIQSEPGRELPVAEGFITKPVKEGTIQVAMTRGMFIKDVTGDKRLPVTVDDVLCGQPTNVTSPNALSYKELVSTGPMPPRWFCCHWWGEKVFEFIACCEMHSALRDIKDNEASFWVCAYANCQHDLGADITVDPEHSSFRRAMRLAEGIMLVLDPNATPFKRIWCDFELYKTIATDKKNLDIVTVSEGKARLISQECLPNETNYYKSIREQQFPIRLLVEGMCRRLEDGDASVELDKHRILETMARDVPVTIFDGQTQNHDDRLAFALKRANNALHAYFALAAWSYAVNAGIVQDFDPMNPGSLNLAETLAKDEERQRLTLTLAHSAKVTDADVAVLASGLPPNLVELSLCFDGNENVTDAGMKALAQRIGLISSLRSLSLDFSSCRDITDIGVSQLMQYMPENLEDLSLFFAHCHDLSAAGAGQIVAYLPPQLVHLNLTMTGSKVDKNFQSAAALKKYVSKYKSKTYMNSAISSVARFLQRQNPDDENSPRKEGRALTTVVPR